MSLFAILASAALASTVQPVQTVTLEHRGVTHEVAYRPVVETRTRTIGMSAGPRPSTQRCVVSARVSVERVIGGTSSAHSLKAMLPGSREFSEHLPGSCHNRGDKAETLLAGKADAIGTHLSAVAAADRSSALAALESAHHFAAN